VERALASLQLSDTDVAPVRLGGSGASTADQRGRLTARHDVSLSRRGREGPARGTRADSHRLRLPSLSSTSSRRNPHQQETHVGLEGDHRHPHRRGRRPGLNPAIRAITIRALREGYRVIGIRRGWLGWSTIEKDADNSDNIQVLRAIVVPRRTGGTSSRTRPRTTARGRPG
jgi:hypothetical protein